MIITPESEVYESVSKALYDSGTVIKTKLPNFSDKSAISIMPFCYVGATSLQTIAVKNHLRSRVSVALNFYGSEDQRWTIDQLKSQAYETLFNLNSTTNYKMIVDPDVTASTTAEESLDNTTIWHATLDVTYKIY